MAAKVSDEQRQQVRTALREAGVNQETVDEIEAGDLDVLYANGWKSKGLILNAQQDLLLAKGLSPGAVGVIMGLKQGGTGGGGGQVPGPPGYASSSSPLDAVSPEALDKVDKSLFVLQGKTDESMDVDNHSDFYCTGFFFRKSGQAVTANHCLEKELHVGSFVDAFSPYYKRAFQLCVKFRHEDLDVAELESTDSEIGHVFLESFVGHAPVGRSVALCTCSIHLSKEINELPQFAVQRGTILRYSSHFKHILYDSATFDGDCGSALVLHDGKVLGLHVEGINQLKERIARNKSVCGRLDALEESMDTAVRGIAHGAYAVVLPVARF